MISRRKFAGVALATSAAAMFGAVSAQAIAREEGKIKCWGVNACKGKNDCKGKGFVEMSGQACAAVGGKVRKDS